VEVVGTLPHERRLHGSYELADGLLYESTGLQGSSTLRAVTAHRPRAAQRRPAGRLFGEGIAVVGDKIWQLTWQQNVAMLRDRATLAAFQHGVVPGRGLGLCYDGKRLVMSDGTALLTFRDPNTFAVLGHVQVDYDGQLNELECADGSVWANVYPTKTTFGWIRPAAPCRAWPTCRARPDRRHHPDDVLNASRWRRIRASTWSPASAGPWFTG